MEDKDALYAKWLSGEISDDQLRQLEGDDALAELKQITQAVDSWSMPKYDTAAGYEKFKKSQQAPPTAKVRKINWFAMGSIAASLLFLVFFGYTFFANQNEVVFAENGQIHNSVLSNGSAYWLNDGSSIEYNDNDWQDQRTIKLTGEALFHVTKGSPFTINTKHGSVRVLGTQFNVRTWGENLYVECYEGSVEVTANNEKTILTANEAVNVLQGKVHDTMPISNESPLWQNAVSRFYNEQLQSVFEELQRQYDVKVNATLSNRSFSGSFRNDDLDSALISICKPLGLEFTISADKKTVTIE